jgi:hypothetical protein
MRCKEAAGKEDDVRWEEPGACFDEKPSASGQILLQITCFRMRQVCKYLCRNSLCLQAD